MIAIDEPEPDDEKPKKDAPKKEPPKNEKESEDRSFEAMLRKLKPQLDKVPDDQRIPPLPPNEDASEAVKDYIRDKMGLTPASNVPNWVIIGTECVERPKMHEGRMGLLEGVPVFAFLYPFETKRLRTVVIHVKDGINPRMIAKAILWGIVGEIPDTVAHGEIRSVDDFFSLRCLERSQLYDQAELERVKVTFLEKASREGAALQAELSRTERELAGTKKAVTESIEREQATKAEVVRQHNRAEGWKVVAWAAIALLPLAAVLVRWLGG